MRSNGMREADEARTYLSAPAEPGEVLRMEVPDGEGLASHTGPESCVWLTVRSEAKR